MSDKVYEGKVTFWNRGRGFGFIQSGLREIFFHAKSFESGYAPILGMTVLFELGPGLPGKPPMAVRVRYPKAADSELVAATSLGGGK